jgi:hypothetical protein
MKIINLEHGMWQQERILVYRQMGRKDGMRIYIWNQGYRYYVGGQGEEGKW